jgi:transposase
MSLHPHPIPPAPEEAARLARIAFPRGNLYLMMRNELGTRFTDQAPAWLCEVPAVEM